MTQVADIIVRFTVESEPGRRLLSSLWRNDWPNWLVEVFLLEEKSREATIEERELLGDEDE